MNKRIMGIGKGKRRDLLSACNHSIINVIFIFIITTLAIMMLIVIIMISFTELLIMNMIERLTISSND